MVQERLSGAPSSALSSGAALGVGDMLHHVAESHLAKPRGESEGQNPHRANRLLPFP